MLHLLFVSCLVCSEAASYLLHLYWDAQTFDTVWTPSPSDIRLSAPVLSSCKVIAKMNDQLDGFDLAKLNLIRKVEYAVLDYQEARCRSCPIDARYAPFQIQFMFK